MEKLASNSNEEYLMTEGHGSAMGICNKICPIVFYLCDESDDTPRAYVPHRNGMQRTALNVPDSREACHYGDRSCARQDISFMGMYQGLDLFTRGRTTCSVDKTV